MKTSIFAKLALGLACSGAAMFADPLSLSIGGGWVDQYQLMGASGEYFASDYAATQNETVWISGYYENTDQYKVFVDGSLVLTTPAIAGPAVDYGDNFGTYTAPTDAGFDSGLFSTGQFQVTTGDVVQIQDIGPLYPNSGSFDAQVALKALAPEPGPFGLMLCAAGLGFYLKKRAGHGRAK